MRKSVFGILVVAVTVTILLAGSTAVTADHAPIEEDHNQTPYGMSNADFAQLWSYVEPYENSTLDNMEFESASTEYALGSDWSTTQPPDTANTWNKNNIRDFESGGYSKSVYPQHVNPEDDGRIKDAYVKIFAIDSATRIYENRDQDEGEQTLYIDKEGTIRGVSDFRVDIPDDETIGWPELLYSHETSEVEEVRVYAEGGRESELIGVDESPSDGVWSVDYEGVEEGHDSIRVEADITATYEEVTHTEPPEVPDDDDEDDEEENDETGGSDYNGGYDGPGTGFSLSSPNKAYSSGPDVFFHTNSEGEPGDHFEDETTITTTVDSEPKDVTFKDPNVKMMVGHHPDGETRVRVYSHDHIWDSVSSPDGTINNLWQYFMNRDTEWDTMVESTSSGDEERHTNIQPVRTAGYPAESGVRYNARAAFRGISTGGTEIDTLPESTPTLPDPVNVPIVEEDEYQYAHAINMEITHDANFEYDDLVSNGVVHGQTNSDIEVTKEEDLVKPILKVEGSRLDREDGHAYVNISVIDPESQNYIPVGSTTTRGSLGMQRPHDLYLNGGSVRMNTNQPKEIRFQYETTPRAEIRFDPKPWYATTDSYVTVEETVTVSDSAGFMDWIYRLFGVIAALVPLWLLEMMFRKGLGFSIIPPEVRKIPRRVFEALNPD